MIKYEVKELIEWAIFLKELGEYVILDEYKKEIFLDTINHGLHIGFEAYKGSLGIIIPVLKERNIPIFVESNIENKFKNYTDKEKENIICEHINIVNELIDKIYKKISLLNNADEVLKEQREIFFIKKIFYEENENLMTKEIKIL